jgi:hypothetical protein
LIRQHRSQLSPHLDCGIWATLLIWLALNSACGADGPALPTFADAFGSPLALHLRRLLFERELVDLNFLIKADPAEPHVLFLSSIPTGRPMWPGACAEGLQMTGLDPLVVADRLARPAAEALVAIPWA